MSQPPEPTPPTWEDLVTYVGGQPATDEAYAQRKLTQAQALVDRYVIGSAPGDPAPTDPASVVPPGVLYEAYLQVGSALWARRDSTSGASTYDTLDSPASPILNDALTGVYPDLDPFLLGGFG